MSEVIRLWNQSSKDNAQFVSRELEKLLKSNNNGSSIRKTKPLSGVR